MISIFKNDDYKAYIERYTNVLLTLTELKQDNALLKVRLDALELENSDLRDKVLRKIQRPKNSDDLTVVGIGGKVKNVVAR